MADATSKTTEPKTKREPYDSIPERQMRVIDHCTRSSDLVVPGMNRRTEA